MTKSALCRLKEQSNITVKILTIIFYPESVKNIYMPLIFMHSVKCYSQNTLALCHSMYFNPPDLVDPLHWDWCLSFWEIGKNVSKYILPWPKLHLSKNFHWNQAGTFWELTNRQTNAWKCSEEQRVNKHLESCSENERLFVFRLYYSFSHPTCITNLG